MPYSDVLHTVFVSQITLGLVLYRVSYRPFITTFNNVAAIWCRSVLLMEATGVTGENHRPAAIH